VSRDRESGFTLPELIMAITILGVIGATIGGVLVAALSTTTGVQDRFDASRAAKQASLYWTPDVKSAESVNPAGGPCGAGAGAGSIALVTFAWTDHPSVTSTSSPAIDVGTPRAATWWLDDTSPARIARRVCGDGPPHEEPTAPIATRIADRDQEIAGLAERASAARNQVAVECSADAVAFAECSTDDPAPVVRLRLRVVDGPAQAGAGAARFKTYEFHVAGTREVR
jgi:prepilin-type N-terminal cleavage/methylation domain-containing protein